MENMDKRTHITKICAYYKLAKNPQMQQNRSVQIVCPIPKIWNSNEKSIVNGI